MRAAVEIYKGIEFVRIFSLPEDQKVLIRQTIARDKIIKILKDDVLLNDCIQYTDYLNWYADTFAAAVTQKTLAPLTETAPALTPVLR